MGKVIVVGSINADFFYYTQRLPLPGQTVGGTKFVQDFGGKGANQAVAARRSAADIEVVMIGAVGDDVFGTGAVSALNAAGVNTQYVATVPGAATDCACIVVDESGENEIVVIPSAGSMLPESSYAERLATVGVNADDVLVTVLEIPLVATEAACRAARAAGARVLITPAPIPSGEKLEAFRALMTEYDDVVTLLVNQHEHPILAEAGVACQSRLVTAGAAGATLVLGGAEHTTQSFAPPGGVIDTTGAGDCFAGTLAAALASGHAPATAMRTAAVAAGLCCGRKGTMMSYASHEEIARHI